ncbi:hypothetical protein Hanom_Chr05g00434461 [Helianthus anomalus]
MSKLQVLSFIYIPFCTRCPLAQNFTSYVLNVSKSCTVCPLSLTQLKFFWLSMITQGYFSLFTRLFNIILKNYNKII